MKRIDKIRSMSIENIARVIIDYGITDEFCKSDCDLDENCECKHDFECCVRWLNEDVGIPVGEISLTGKAMTNGDMIRSMTGEQLTVTLVCPNEMGLAEIECDKSDECNCCQCLLDWLGEEANER